MKLTRQTWFTLSVLNRCHVCRRNAVKNLRRLRWWCKNGELKAHHARTLVRAADGWKRQYADALKELTSLFYQITA